MKETLGERIRKERLRYGMSQVELARRVGISKTAMNQIEMGETTDPRVSRLRAIADILGVSMDYLAGRQDEDGTPTPIKRPHQPTALRTRPRTAAPVG
jgi:transcriptional regulator with XRE-family HTH domain